MVRPRRMLRASPRAVSRKAQCPGLRSSAQIVVEQGVNPALFARGDGRQKNAGIAQGAEGREPTFQELLQRAEPGGLCRAAHHLQGHQQRLAAGQPRQLVPHVLHHGQLPLTGIASPCEPPGAHVTPDVGLVRPQGQPVRGHGVIERLGQCVHFRQVDRELGHGLGKQAFQRAGNAAELGIAFGEIMVAIQLLQEEAGGRSLDRTVEKIAVARAKAQCLPAFDRRNRRPQGFAVCLLTQGAHSGELGADAAGRRRGIVHGSSLSSAPEPVLGARL